MFCIVVALDILYQKRSYIVRFESLEIIKNTPCSVCFYRGGRTGTPSAKKFACGSIVTILVRYRFQNLLLVEPLQLSLQKGFRPVCAAQKNTPCSVCFYRGGRTGTRTLDPLIKSQLLYQLSYASKTVTIEIIEYFPLNASFYNCVRHAVEKVYFYA